eukprot:759327-Hanusia_phi.AAC.7
MAAESDLKAANTSPNPEAVNAGKLFEWVGSLFFNQSQLQPSEAGLVQSPAVPALQHGENFFHHDQAHQKAMSAAAVDMVKPRSAMRTTYRSRKQSKRVRFCTAIENSHHSGSNEKQNERNNGSRRSRSCYPEALAQDSEQLISNHKANRCRSMSVREFVIF